VAEFFPVEIVDLSAIYTKIFLNMCQNKTIRISNVRATTYIDNGGGSGGTPVKTAKLNTTKFSQIFTVKPSADGTSFTLVSNDVNKTCIDFNTLTVDSNVISSQCADSFGTTLPSRKMIIRDFRNGNEFVFGGQGSDMCLYIVNNTAEGVTFTQKPYGTDIEGQFLKIEFVDSIALLTKAFLDLYQNKIIRLTNSKGFSIDNMGAVHGTRIQTTKYDSTILKRSQLFFVKPSSDYLWFTLVGIEQNKNCLDFYNTSTDAPIYAAFCGDANLPVYPARKIVIRDVRNTTEFMFGAYNTETCLYVDNVAADTLCTQKPCGTATEGQFFSITVVNVSEAFTKEFVSSFQNKTVYLGL
jgi:hypothetical protein